MFITNIQIHNIIEESRANGPGIRFTIFFQGCKFNCKGCINPATHHLTKGYSLSTNKLMKMIKKCKNNIEGVTITGGEPFLQEEALHELVKQIKSLNLTIIISTGFELDELKREIKNLDSITKYCDIIIAGRFHHNELSKTGLIGSTNKKILFISDIYSKNDLLAIPRMEILISNDEIKATGTGIYDFFNWVLF